ncbi:MAG: OmpH family outer membrane protein, partial [Wenyingzhuangia sp.]
KDMKKTGADPLSQYANLIKTAVVIATTALMMSALQYFKTDQQRIAYVYVDDVIAEYHAMQDADSRWKIQESKHKQELDKFTIDIQEKIEWLQEHKKKLTENELLDKQYEIMDMERIHQHSQQKSYKELDSIKNSWLVPIYEEVNQYIKTYSQNNGYDYVLGNVGNGNIMYGNHTHDITLEVIDGINVAYNIENLKN